MSETIQWPKIIFGTSSLGNLYVALDDRTKLDIVAACMEYSSKQKPVVFDCAGKYGAGLALESLGRCLRTLRVAGKDVLISNKLGWFRTNELPSDAEPTFEIGVWRELRYDAVQKISYEGILQCYEQGNQLLDGYKAQLVSIHDPDEYLANARNESEKMKRYEDILDAYRALQALKSRGEVKAIGVGSKDWRLIERIVHDVSLDWIMIANSFTLHNHPYELLTFMNEMRQRDLVIINAGVFNGGFLVGEDYYNYRLMDPACHQQLFQWRQQFFRLCEENGLSPAEACIIFAYNAPGVRSLALNAATVDRVRENIKLIATMDEPLVSNHFWQQMKTQHLIESTCTHSQ